MSRVAERALDRGLPLLMLHDGGGHRIQEGLDAAPFARATTASRSSRPLSPAGFPSSRR